MIPQKGDEAEETTVHAHELTDLLPCELSLRKR